MWGEWFGTRTNWRASSCRWSWSNSVCWCCCLCWSLDWGSWASSSRSCSMKAHTRPAAWQTRWPWDRPGTPDRTASTRAPSSDPTVECSRSSGPWTNSVSVVSWAATVPRTHARRSLLLARNPQILLCIFACLLRRGEQTAGPCMELLFVQKPDGCLVRQTDLLLDKIVFNNFFNSNPEYSGIAIIKMTCLNNFV